MAKINVTGNAVVLTSTIKFEDIKKVRKYRKDALCLYDEENNPIFAIDVGCHAQCNEFGIAFDGKTHDENGYATYTTLIPPCAEGVEEFIADVYGTALLKLNEFEAKFPAIIEAIDNERKAVLEAIALN